MNHKCEYFDYLLTSTIFDQQLIENDFIIANTSNTSEEIQIKSINSPTSITTEK